VLKSFRKYYCVKKTIYICTVMKTNNVYNIQVKILVSLFSTLRILISGSMMGEQRHFAIYNRCILKSKTFYARVYNRLNGVRIFKQFFIKIYCCIIFSYLQKSNKWLIMRQASLWLNVYNFNTYFYVILYIKFFTSIINTFWQFLICNIFNFQIHNFIKLWSQQDFRDTHKLNFINNSVALWFLQDTYIIFYVTIF